MRSDIRRLQGPKGIATDVGGPEGIPQTPPHQAQELARQGAILLDVREAHEWEAARIPGSLWIPMSQIGRRWTEIPAGRSVVVVCHSGGRSHAVARFLREQGVPDAQNLAGGIVAWHHAGLEVDQGPA